MREESKNRYVDRKLYFDELCETAEQFYIEYLKKFKEVNPFKDEKKKKKPTKKERDETLEFLKSKI